MKLTKLEQSGFILETDKGFRMAMDIGLFTPLEKLNGLSIDAMLVSHIHGDHFSLEHIKKIAPTKVYLNEECIEAVGGEKIISEIVEAKIGDVLNINDDIKVTFFDVDHGPNTKIKPRENFGFLIEADGEKIYFAGDMFNPSGIDVTELEVDKALLPVGGFYTFGPKEAAAFASTFKKIGKVVPMHYEKVQETRQEFIDIARREGLKII